MKYEILQLKEPVGYKKSEEQDGEPYEEHIMVRFFTTMGEASFVVPFGILAEINEKVAVAQAAKKEHLM